MNKQITYGHLVWILIVGSIISLVCFLVVGYINAVKKESYHAGGVKGYEMGYESGYKSRESDEKWSRECSKKEEEYTREHQPLAAKVCPNP